MRHRSHADKVLREATPALHNKLALKKVSFLHRLNLRPKNKNVAFLRIDVAEVR
jgi:hypothetical protein